VSRFDTVTLLVQTKSSDRVTAKSVITSYNESESVLLVAMIDPLIQGSAVGA